MTPPAARPLRLAQLTAGTGSFYCGTCVRDNGLVLGLRELGHAALSVPLYLPQVVGERNASEGMPVLIGGVNAYLQQHVGLLRGRSWMTTWIDRLLDSKLVLKLAAKGAGMTAPESLGPMTWSMLLGDEGRQAKEIDRLAAWLSGAGGPKLARPTAPFDALILSNALLMGLARPLRRATGARVLCTLQGEDEFLDALDDEHRAKSWRTLAERAEHVDAFVAVSRFHAELMTERLGLDPAKVHVVPNGVDPSELVDPGLELPRGPRPESAAPVVAYLARMCPDKGLHVLVDAFIALSGTLPNGGPAPELHVGGAVTALDEAYVTEQRAKLDAAGLSGRVRFEANMTPAAKRALLARADVLSVPAVYRESFGLYAVEAMAAGVPVVLPDHAALPEVLALAPGGVLHRPEDPAALAGVLARLLADPDGTRALGERGRRAVERRLTLEHMAQGVVDVVLGVPRAGRRAA